LAFAGKFILKTSLRLNFFVLALGKGNGTKFIRKLTFMKNSTIQQKFNTLEVLPKFQQKMLFIIFISAHWKMGAEIVITMRK
jgi:hypothetical protein